MQQRPPRQRLSSNADVVRNHSGLTPSRRVTQEGLQMNRWGLRIHRPRCTYCHLMVLFCTYCHVMLRIAMNGDLSGD